MMKSVSDLELSIKIDNTSIKKIQERKSLGAAGISALRRFQEFADKQNLSIYNAFI